MIGFTAMPFYVYERIGGGAVMSGAIGAGLSLSYAAVCILGGGLVAKARIKLRVASLGVFGFACFFLLSSFFRDPIVFACLSMCGFGCVALAWPTLHAWLGGEPDLSKRGRYMARFNLSWSLGMALGTLFSGYLFDKYYRLPYLCLFAFASFAAAAIFFQPQERSYFGEAPRGTQEKHQSHTRLSETYLLPTWVACVTGWCLLSACRTVFPKHFEAMVVDGQLTLFAGPPPVEGWPVGAATLFSILAFGITSASFAVFMFMGHTASWRHTFRFVVALELMACAASWLLATTHSMVVLLACYTVVGVNVYAAFFAALFYSMANPVKKHRRTSINESLVGVGSFVGPLSFGWAAHEWTVSTPFMYAPLFMLISIAVQVILLRRRRSVAVVKR
jgi:MFS family permease